MKLFRRRSDEEVAMAFRQCPGCGYDILTGEGEHGCGWYDCPYLPDELKVICPRCNHNFATGEGTPACGRTPRCDWSVEGYRHVRTLRRYLEERAPPPERGA